MTVAGIYGGVFAKTTTYGRHIRTDLQAPSKEEVEHEFQIQSPTNRQYTRFTRSVRASLSITATKIAAEVEDRKAADQLLRATLDIQAKQIEARVTKEGGNPSSFWWKLLDSYFSVGNDSEEKFRVDKDGAYVNGIIRATGGKIGGFDIQANYLSYNGQIWNGTNTTGAYIGQSGIQLGKNFKVDMQGNLNAASGTFDGAVRAGNITYGGDSGYFSGGGISNGSIYGDRLVGNTITTAYTSNGINTSLAYADFANGAFNGYNWVGNLFTGKLKVSGTVELLGQKIGKNSLTVSTPGGGSKTIYYLGYS